MYADVIAGLQDALERVEGIAQVLPYEPTTIQRTPTVYLKLDEFTRENVGQVTAMRYRILARLILLWQDSRISSEQVVGYLNSICAAVDADPQLAGAIPRGVARVADGREGLRSIGGTVYKVLDVFIDVVEKDAYQSGI